LGFAIYYSARAAAADAFFHEDTPESLAQAVRADPGNAAYHQLYAEHLESLGHDSTRERETSALLSPLDSRYWIDLGTQAEVHADYSAAERYYLKAASVDRKFAPRWALMNFYLRRHEEGPFWQWAEKAMDMAYGDSSEIFRLCWLMTDDKESIARKIPQTDYLRGEYLRFLLLDGHIEVAAPIALSVAERATPGQLDLVLDFCGRAMTVNTEAAVQAWNALTRRGLEPFAPLDPGRGAIVTNGALRIAPKERGFDWHLTRLEGLAVTMIAAGGVSVELTGEQAQAVTAMDQWIPVKDGAHYRIDYQYSGEADGPLEGRQASGLAWEIENPITRVVVARGNDLKPGASGQTDHLDFTASGMSVAVLALRYQRAPGTVRRAEKFTIEAVSSRPGVNGIAQVRPPIAAACEALPFLGAAPGGPCAQ
jgi:hypothetical protein